MRYKQFTVAALITLMLLLAGCSSQPRQISLSITGDPPQPQPDAGEGILYYFGFDQRLDPAEDVRMYVPFLKYLERATGYRFKLQPVPRTGSVAEAMGSGTIHFAAFGTLSYLDAHKRYGVKALVAARTADGGADYRALIITRPESSIRTIKDLRGRSLALGSPTSTQGNLIPRIMLQQAGISLSDLSAFQNHSSHFETANAVLSGRFHAGAVQDTLGRELVRKGLVRVVAESDLFPSSTISVASDVPEPVAEAVRRALLDFDPTGRDKHGLYRWDQSEMPLGFIPVNQKALDRVQMMAERLGLLR